MIANEIYKEIQLGKKEVRILEVGCGTGQMARYLSKELKEYRGAISYTGLDLSQNMLDKFKDQYFKSQCIICGEFLDYSEMNDSNYDVIIFSYVLALNIEWGKMVFAARRALNSDGTIAVVEFDKTQSRLYQKWMNLHQVGINIGIREELDRLFIPIKSFSKSKGLLPWSYFAGLWEKGQNDY
ncbi:MAG: hypothetical protein Kapaf2KO_01440 [Candidatus Kapaibacteriales bacterium]